MNQPVIQAIRTCQIIAVAMMTGVVIFAGIALTQTLEARPADPKVDQQVPKSIPAETAVTFFMGLFAVVLRFLVRKQLDSTVAGYVQQAEPGAVNIKHILQRYQARTIVSLVPLLFIAFLALLMFIISDDWTLFYLAMAVLVWMALTFSTETKFRTWVRKLTGQSEYAGDESL